MRAWLAALMTYVAVSVSAAQPSPPAWPPLPTTGFIAGRPATDADAAGGNAVFVLKAYGIYFGKPMDIVIPQYAYLTRQGQKPVPVIVIQAEIGKGIKLFGVRDFAGRASTARDYEVQLLGPKPPH